MEQKTDIMKRFCITWVAALCASACASEVVATSTGEQASTQLQGTQLQGTERVTWTECSTSRSTTPRTQS